MGDTKIPEDLMCNVRVFKMEEAMQHLERSFAPMVQFREDIEQMRQEAHAARLVHIKTAMEIIYHEVAGLLVRPEFYTEEKK